MVISNILRRGLFRVSNVIRSNIGGGATHKRLLVKKFESLLSSEKRFYGAYEGDGKTVGFVINKKGAEVLLILSSTPEGFIVSTGQQLVGPLIIFPHSLMSWNVLNASEINEESLSLFRLLDPKIDILVVGYGSKNAYTKEMQDNFQNFCRKYGIRFELLPTENAIGVYNFLADERRLVAAALIPPTDFSPFRFDQVSEDNLLEDVVEEDLSQITDEKPKVLLK